MQRGANPNITNKKGESALSMAKKEGLAEVVALFEGSRALGRRKKR